MDPTEPMADDARLAFPALLERHRGIVLKVAATYARDPHDRADIAQEIAAQAWRAWPQYDASRSFSTWMYRIALNVAIDFVRGNARRSRHAVPLDEALHDVAAPADAGHELRDGVQVLMRFVDTCKPLDRALLLLYLEERSTREIAEVLGLGESNVTTRISRLKQRIRDHVAG